MAIVFFTDINFTGMFSSCVQIYGKCTLLVANLAGPTSVLKLDSREVKCMMYWLPPLDKVPLTVSFITYADQIRMAVISDRSVIPNPDLITRDFNHKVGLLKLHVPMFCVHRS